MARSGERALYAIVVVAALAAHVTSLGDGFVFDDPAAITINPLVQGPSPWRGLVSSDFWGRSGRGAVGTWRPLVTLSFWIDQHLGGGRAIVFHASNVLFHALAALALALALARATRRPRLAIAAAALFAVLAVNGEAVASLVGRADVMAAGFCFLCWRFWRSNLVAAALAFLGALLCKESVIVWPLCLFAIERALPADPALDDRATDRAADASGFASAAAGRTTSQTALQNGLRAARPYLVLAAAAVVYFIGRWFAVGSALTAHISPNNNPLVDASLPVRVWTSLRLFLLALRLTLLPLNSSPDYSAAEIMPDRSFALEPLVGLVALALVLYAALRLPRRRPLLSASASLFAIPWLIVCNALVPLPTIFAERLLYLPAAGAALALASGLAQLASERRAFAIVAVTILAGGNLALDVSADRMWRDELTLFSAAVQVSPRSARAWINYGAALQKEGNLEAALAAYARSLEVYPTWKGETSLGITLDQLGQARAAEPHLRRAVAAAPDELDAVHNLALYLARHGAHAEAAALLRPVVAAHPEAGVDRRLLEQLDRDLSRAPH